MTAGKQAPTSRINQCSARVMYGGHGSDRHDGGQPRIFPGLVVLCQTDKHSPIGMKRYLDKEF